MPKLTSKDALEFVTRIETLNDQISAVYREVGEYSGFGNVNVIRDIVKAREAATNERLIADGFLASLDTEEDDVE